MIIPNRIGKGKGSGPKANFERTRRPPEWCVLECTTISTDEMKQCGLKSYRPLLRPFALVGDPFQSFLLLVSLQHQDHSMGKVTCVNNCQLVRHHGYYFFFFFRGPSWLFRLISKKSGMITKHGKGSPLGHGLPFSLSFAKFLGMVFHFSRFVFERDPKSAQSQLKLFAKINFGNFLTTSNLYTVFTDL